MKKLSSGYIMSVVSAVLLLLEVVGVKVNVPYVNEVVMGVLGVLVALGLVSGGKSTYDKKKSDKSNSDSDDGENVADNVVNIVEDGSIEDKIEAIPTEISDIVTFDDNTADGDTRGGNTANGNTTGSNTANGDTAGGNTANGNADK